MLLLLVRGCNPGIFLSLAFRIIFHEPIGQILGATDLVNTTALASFIGTCQFKYGGIAKAPGEHAGEFLEYSPRKGVPRTSFETRTTPISLAAIAMFPPPESAEGSTWAIEPLDPLINAKLSTAQWARDHIPSKKST